MAEGRPCRTRRAVHYIPALFNYLKSALEDEDEIVVARGKDPRVVKEEVVDAGRELGAWRMGR